MNPGYALTYYLPTLREPFGHLGTSPCGELAEREGFRPRCLSTSPVFKTGAFNRSAISGNLRPASSRDIIPMPRHICQRQREHSLPRRDLSSAEAYTDYQNKAPVSGLAVLRLVVVCTLAKFCFMMRRSFSCWTWQHPCSSMLFRSYCVCWRTAWACWLALSSSSRAWASARAKTVVWLTSSSAWAWHPQSCAGRGFGRQPPALACSSAP